MTGDRFRRHGQITVETVAGLLVLIPVFLGLFDIMIVYMGYNVNLTACRDAARAVSNCVPDTNILPGNLVTVPAASQLYARANSVIKSMIQTGGGYILGPRLGHKDLKNGGPAITLTGFQRPPNESLLGGPFQGEVNVTTTVRVNLPVAIPNVTPTFVDLETTSSFPLTSVAPSQ